MFESINTQLHKPSASYNVMQYMLWRPLCKHIIWISDIGSCTVNWYLFFDYNGEVRNNQCFVPHTRGWLCKVLTGPHIVRLYTHSRIRGMIKSDMLKAIRFWWCIWKISSTNTTMNCVNQLIRVRLCLNLNLNLKKCLLDKKQIQAGNNVINDTYRVFYVGRPLQRRWAHRWRKSHPNILKCMNRHRAHEVLTFWEHEFGICNQNESTPLGNAPSRHTRGTQLT